MTVSLLVMVIGLPAGAAWAQQRTKIRYALGDVISIDELPLLIAVERAKARGVDVEVTAFKNEDIATLTVDHGLGRNLLALERRDLDIHAPCLGPFHGNQERHLVDRDDIPQGIPDLCAALSKEIAPDEQGDRQQKQRLQRGSSCNKHKFLLFYGS
jgi:hypothetical protein